MFTEYVELTKYLIGKESMGKLKLTVEMVPKSSHYNNMRKVLSKEGWDEIRKSTYRKYNYKCGICGDKGKMNCHEIWEYDEGRGVQTLKGYISLCTMCHMVKHIGFASILATKGKLDYEEVVKHFCKVNKCSKKKFREHTDEMFRVFRKQSNMKWRVDLSKAHKNKNDFVTKEVIP
jgi:hypothetical protein